MPIGAIFALLAFAGVFLLFVGLSQMRRSAGGSEDFQARLAAYGVTTAGAQTLPPATGLRDTLNAMLADKTIFRSPGALGPGYERPEIVTDEDIEIYLRPLVRTEQRTRDVQRFVEAFDNKHTQAVEPRLRALRAPTLIAWATDDIYFPTKWAHWLAETIPGAKPPVELVGARLFFPEERSDEFNRLLRDHLLST